MSYGPQDPALLERTLEKQWLNGEISLQKARALAAENRALIEAEYARIQQEKAIAKNNEEFARNKFEAESKIARELANRPKQLSGEEKTAQEKRIADARAEEALNKVASERQKAAERSGSRFSYVDRQRPSSGTSSYPTGQSNPRSSGGYTGPTGNAPSGEMTVVPRGERRTGGYDAGPRKFIPTPNGTAVVGADGVTAWKERNPLPTNKPSWGSGGTSAAQATRGQPPVSAASGTPARPVPFSPNRTPAMRAAAGGGVIGAIGAIAGEILRDRDLFKDPGKSLRRLLPEWAGGPKFQDPLANDPFKARKKGDPEPDPNDPFGDPNRPKPDPTNPFGNPEPEPNYPPGTPGNWVVTTLDYITGQTSTGRVGNSSDERIFIQEVDRPDGSISVRTILVDVNGVSTTIAVDIKHLSKTIARFEPFNQPQPATGQPENLPDPSTAPTPEYSPAKTPAPNPSAVPSSSPIGALTPIGAVLGGSLPSPGGDRAPRPELKPETEVKPKPKSDEAPGFAPGFKPEGETKPETKPDGAPDGAPGSRTVKKYEPIATGAPSPKPGINPGSDQKTDPRDRDKTIFDPSGKGGTFPAPDPQGSGSGGTGTGGPSTPTTCRYKEDETESTTVKVPVSLFGVARVEQTRTLQVHEKMTEPTALMFDQLLEIRKGIDKIQKTTLIIRVLNTLSTIASIHNMMMLSRNLAQTAGDATSAVINAIGRISGTIDKDQELIDVNTILAKTTDKFFEEMLGEATWKSTKKTWNKYSAIYSSAAMITQTVRGMADSAKSVAEWTANNTGRIGNALKKFGAVGENAYPWMSENVASQSKFDRALDKFKTTGENMEDTFSSVESVASESMSIKDESEELKEQAEKFEKSIKELSPKAATENDVKKAASTTEKAASPGQETTATDLNKVE